MPSSPYLTPPPTVPATRHPSLARPSIPLITNTSNKLQPSSSATTRQLVPSQLTPTLAPFLPSPTTPYGYPHFQHLPASPYRPYAGWHSVPSPHSLQPFHQPVLAYSYPPPRPPMSVYGRPHPPRDTVNPSHLHPAYHPRLEPTRTLVKTSRDELDDSPAPTSPRADKRRRTKKNPSNASASNPDRHDSPSMGSAQGGGASPGGSGQDPQRRMSGLAPIKPIGFAAAREHRRESGGMGDGSLPSPVVMGFDFQKVDEDQLKTVSRGHQDQRWGFKTLRHFADRQVRDTISIKAQQEALIAQRRRDVAASIPNTPKELTFKGWQPKDSERTAPAAGTPTTGSGGVGRRREKTRDKVERMSINTAGGDKDSVPGSKSAPMNQNLSAQQSDLSASQGGLPSGHLPNGSIDPRTAPMSNVRGSRADDGELNRQQGAPAGSYYRRYEPGHSHNRSVTDGGPRTAGGRIVTSSSRGGYDDRMPPPTAGGAGGSRNGAYTGTHGSGTSHPGPSATYTNQEHGGSSPSQSPPPRQGQPQTARAAPQMSARREAFLAPYNQLYDLLHQADGLRYNLQELMHRYEGLYAGQITAMQEFKATAASSNTLLGNLQQSAESLKEMVRYEVGRSIAAGGAGAGAVEGSEESKKEVEELKERIKKLEELAEKAEKKD